MNATTLFAKEKKKSFLITWFRSMIFIIYFFSIAGNSGGRSNTVKNVKLCSFLANHFVCVFALAGNAEKANQKGSFSEKEFYSHC